MDSWINAAISLQCSFTSIHNWDTDQAGRWDKNSVSKTTTFTLRHRAVDHSVPLVRDRKENVFQSPVNTAEPACQNIRNQYVLELVSTSCLHKHLQNCVEVTPKRKLSVVGALHFIKQLFIWVTFPQFQPLRAGFTTHCAAHAVKKESSFSV